MCQDVVLRINESNFITLQLFLGLVLFVSTTFASKRKVPNLTGIFQKSSNKCAINVYKVTLGNVCCPVGDIIGYF